MGPARASRRTRRKRAPVDLSAAAGKDSTPHAARAHRRARALPHHRRRGRAGAAPDGARRRASRLGSGAPRARAPLPPRAGRQPRRGRERRGKPTLRHGRHGGRRARRDRSPRHRALPRGRRVDWRRDRAAPGAACLAHATLALLPLLRTPTLVLVGEDDILTPPRYGRALAAALSRGEVMLLPASGHACFLETPKPLAERVLRFLARHPLAA